MPAPVVTWHGSCRPGQPENSGRGRSSGTVDKQLDSVDTTPVVVNSPPNGRPLSSSQLPLLTDGEAGNRHNISGRPFGGLRTTDLGAERSGGSVA